MNAVNLEIYLQTQEILIRVEGMKADNQERKILGQSVAWTGDHFESMANYIESIMKDISHD